MPSNGSLLIDWRVVNGFEAMAVGYFLDVNLGKGTDQWSFLSSIDSSVILSSMANNVKDFDYQYRDQYTADGYIIGQNSNLTNDDLQYANIWTQSIESHLSKWDGKDDSLLANQIWDAVFDSPRNRILPTESTVSKKGGYVFWAQDLEFDISATPDGLKNQFKGMIALLWAGRKVLGDDFKIIPIVSNSIQRNWDGSRYYVDISALIDTKLKKLGLSNLASRSDGRSWNLMSYLKENKLIDGFIGEGYKKDFVGQLDPDSAPFKVSQNLAYAVLGNWTKNLEQASKPIKSDFYGSLPMNAGGYFTDKAPAEKFKSSSFDPVPKNLLAYNASKPQIQNNTQIVDLTDLSVGETAQLQVSLSRDADYNVQAGFYLVADSQGSVVDPITGKLIAPEDSDYAQIAMASENIVSQLSGLSLSENGFVDVAQLYELGNGLIAPYVRVMEPGAEGLYFSFALANSDQINHFAQLSANSFGAEDSFGGGDLDYNDLTLSLKFVDVVRP